MRRYRITAILLSILLIVGQMTAFAGVDSTGASDATDSPSPATAGNEVASDSDSVAGDVASGATGTEGADAEADRLSSEYDSDVDDVDAAKSDPDYDSDIDTDVEDDPDVSSDLTTEEPLTLSKASNAEAKSDEWTSEDFTYEYYSKLMYGCDYTRQLYVNGQIITGFSESGKAKLESGNTDLVLPSATPDGETVTGVGTEAFKGMGLTSVEFPKGMLVPYDDTITHTVTRRGNFIIHEAAFANNDLTEVVLPAGVMACMANSFQKNKIRTVTFPRTIWWIETLAFADNEITTVNFPETCDFRMEMHGMTFAGNNIKSVRLPDYTEVVNKHVFAMNPGMEPMTEEIAKKYSTNDYEKYLKGGAAESGIVYMYTDNAGLFNAQRIHTLDRPTKNQWSPFQKLVQISSDTPDPDTDKWNAGDFTYDGTVLTGLSASGIKKRETHTELVIPSRTPSGKTVYAIDASDNFNGGLFGEEKDGVVEGFDSVTLPNSVRVIGERAFAGLGLREVVFPQRLEKIEMQAFAGNRIEHVILPDSVTEIGGGAFASNPTLKSIVLPVNDEYTEIEDGTFGCSDMNNWMADLTEIEIPDTITKIGSNAFAGNNFRTIEIPSSVTEIGRFAFSTKNYLQTPTTLILNEGLRTIGNRAFRNKKIASVVLPTTLEGLPALTFEKKDTDWDIGHGVNNSLVTKVFVTTEEQYNDKANFQESDHQKIYLSDPKKWTADDFTYDDIDIYGQTGVRAVTGFSEDGQAKSALNSKVTLPASDSDGGAVLAVAEGAFSDSGITELTIQDNTIRYIGGNAFSGNGLTELTLPEGVEAVGAKAFADNKIRRVSFSASIGSIGEKAFTGNRINALEFEEGGTADLEIASETFAGNQLKSLQAPDNLDVLDKDAFAGNPGMDSDEGVVYIYKLTEGGTDLRYKGAGTSDCQDIKFGEIPPELAPWGPRHYTFSGDTITGFSEDGEAKVAVDPYIVLPGVSDDGTVITTVGGVGTVLADGSTSNAGAFEGYSGNKGTAEEGYRSPVRGVEFAPSITTVKMKAFMTCAIEEIVIPDTVTTIEPSAFASNYGTTSIVLSGSMTEIPEGAFVTNATTMDMSTGIDELIIPEGVTKIGKRAFSGQHVKKLTLPSTLTEIGETAFQNHQITELDIPAGVKKIDKRAFEVRQDGAAPLPQKLTLHEGLVEIGQEAFGQTSLESVMLPSTLKVLADDAFVDWKDNGREDGEKVILRTSVNDQAEGTGAYSGIVVSGVGHEVVFDKMVGTGWDYSDFEYSDDGTVITGWSASGNVKRHLYAAMPQYVTMVMPDKASYDSDVWITEIGDNAFRLELASDDGSTGEVTMRKFDCDSPYGIQTMEFPERLEKIGDAAFEYNNLQAVNLSAAEHLYAIGTSAFHGNHLSTLDIPETVTDLGDGAFAMNNIVSLGLPESITVIPQGCFSMNIFLAEIEIPDTVTEIGDTAFAGARLESLRIPSSVTRIGRKAFHLHHLRTLYIPGNVKIIDESAFEGTFKDSTLTRLVLGEGIEYIGKYAFKEALLEEVNLPNSLKDMGIDPFYSNKGKDGSRVVELHTGNLEHLKFNNDEYHGLENGESKHYHVVILDKDKMELTEEEIAERDEALDELAGVIFDANAALSEGSYTASSYAAVREAIDAANKLYDDDKTLKSEVLAARAEIMRALRSLEPVNAAASEASKEKSRAANTLTRTLIDIYNNVTAAPYTTAAYKAFMKEVAAAEAILADDSSDADALNNANSDLLKAWTTLMQKGGKKSQSLSVRARTKTLRVKAKTIKKKAKKFGRRKVFIVKGARGKVTYKKVSGSKKIKVTSKGAVKIGKGLKRGTYKVKVKVTAAGNGTYKSASKTVTIKVRVK